MAMLDEDDKKWLLENFATKKDYKRLEKKVDTISNRLDSDHIALKNRVVKVEDNLGITPSEF